MSETWKDPTVPEEGKTVVNHGERRTVVPCEPIPELHFLFDGCTWYRRPGDTFAKPTRPRDWARWAKGGEVVNERRLSAGEGDALEGAGRMVE